MPRQLSFIQYQGVREFLGYFNTEEEASAAYQQRRKELTPEITGDTE